MVAVAGLSGRTLRYAEVTAGPALRRLGAADFDLDAEAAVFGDGDGLEAVAAALAEGLGGTEAPALVVVAHPTATTSFFTPLPVGMAPEARDAQIRQETALLADLAPTEGARARSRLVRSDGGHDWYHVVHVGARAHGRLSRLADALGLPTYDVADSTRSASAAAADGAGSGVLLLVGAYAGHTEVAVARAGAFQFGSHGPTTAPLDTAYFALAALQQAGVGAPDVARLATYGDDATAERLAPTAEFVGQPALPLDPFRPFGRRPDAGRAELATFGPVLGAALTAAG